MGKYFPGPMIVVWVVLITGAVLFSLRVKFIRHLFLGSTFVSAY